MVQKKTPAELPDWFIELIHIRSTSGLDDQQQKQFDDFVEDFDDARVISELIEEVELTVAVLDQQMSRSSQSGEAEPLKVPMRLHEQILCDAKNHFQNADLLSHSAPPSPTVSKSTPALGRRNAMGEIMGWLVAAAAIAVLLTGWNPFESGSARQPQLTARQTVQQQFDDFVASPPDDLKRVSWQPTTADSDAGGEVLWSDSQQSGFMVFENLPANDSQVSQYQLWIFDTDPTQPHPVDGGTFDVSDTGESIVKIDARVPVNQAVMFAITEERPGGVVVSSRKRLPLLAKVN